MHLLGAGSLNLAVARNLPGGRSPCIRIRWPRQHICDLTASASRRKDTGSSSRRPRRGSAYDGSESGNSDDDDDIDDEDGDSQVAKYGDLLYGTSDYGIVGEMDSDTAAIAEFVRAKQLATMRRARLSAAADAAAAARVRDAGLQEYLATQGLGSISQFRELVEQEAQHTMEELKEANLAALEVQIAAEGGDLEADWAALESTRSTTGLAKSSGGVRPGSGTGAPLPEDTLLAPPSNPRVDWLRSQSQQMRRKRRLFEPVDGDGSLYDDPLSGSGSDDDGTSAYDYKPQSSSNARRAVSRWSTGRSSSGTSDEAPSRPPQPALPPKVNPFLSLPRRPSDAFDPSNDVEAILDRMMDSDLTAAQQQLRVVNGRDIDEADDQRYDDDGYDEYGNRRPGAADPATANDEYADRMLRALRGALTDKSNLGRDGVEGLAARPTRPGSAGSSHKNRTTASGSGKASKQLLAAAPDDYDALAELLEAVGGELEQQVVDGMLDDDDDDEGVAASPGSKRPLTTTELLRSQVPLQRGPSGSAPARPQLLGRPTATGPSGLDSPRATRPPSPSSSSPFPPPSVRSLSAFAEDDAQLLEELLSDDAFTSNPAAGQADVVRSQSLDDLLLDSDGDGDREQPSASSGSRLPSLESKPMPRGRTGGASSANSSSSSSRGGSSRSGKVGGPGGTDKIRSSRTASFNLARRDQEELLRDDWDADLYGLDEQIGDLGSGTKDGSDAWLLSSAESARSGGLGAAAAKPAPQLLAKPSKQVASNVGSVGAGAGVGRSSSTHMDVKARASGAAALGEKDLGEILRGLSELDDEMVKEEELGDGDWQVVGPGAGSTTAPPPVAQLAARPMRSPANGGTGGGSTGTSITINNNNTSTATNNTSTTSTNTNTNNTNNTNNKKNTKRSDITPSKRLREKTLSWASRDSPEATARGSGAEAQMPQPYLTGPSTAPPEGAPGADPNPNSSASAAISLEEALAVLANPKRAAALARLEGKPLLSAPPPRQGTSDNTSSNAATANNTRTKSSTTGKSSSSSVSSSKLASSSQIAGPPRTSVPARTVAEANPPQQVPTSSTQEPLASRQQQQQQSSQRNKDLRTSAGSSAAAPEPVPASGPGAAQATMEVVGGAQAKSPAELAAAAAAAAATLLDAGKAGQLRSFRSVATGTKVPIAAVPPPRPAVTSPSPPPSSPPSPSPPPAAPPPAAPTASAITADVKSTIAVIPPHPVRTTTEPSSDNTSPVTGRDVAATTEGTAATSPKVHAWTRIPAMRPWRPGRTSLPVPSAAEPSSTAATVPFPATAASRPPSINADMRKGLAADGPLKPAALPAAPSVPSPGTSQVVGSRKQRDRLWDPALQLDRAPASRPVSTLYLSAGVGSTASLPRGSDGTPTASSPSTPMSFPKRLRRLRLMVIRGELVEGVVDAKFDVSKYQGVAAVFPKLANLGVAQPVWVWADGLLGWRCKRIPETQTTAASAEMGAGTGETQAQEAPTGSQDPAAAHSGASQGSVAAGPVDGGSGGGGPDRGRPGMSRPYKRIWAAVTSVRALSEDEARFLGTWATAGGAEGGAAAAARLRSGGILADYVPADLSVQAVEVLAPASQRWNSLSRSFRRQMLDLNRGRTVSARVLALSERGAYCEVNMEAPRLSPDLGDAGAAVAGREGKLKDGAAVGAPATPSTAALLSSDGEDAGEATAAATAEELGRAPRAAPRVAPYSQLCFLPVESMAGALAADWPQIVQADKDARVRALARATGDFGPLLSARARTTRTAWTRIMRPGDVVECRVEGSVLTPVSVLLGLLSQNTHQASMALLEALDLAPPRSETTAPDAGANYASGITMGAAGAKVEQLSLGSWRLKSAMENEERTRKSGNGTAAAVPAGKEAPAADGTAPASSILMDDTTARVSAILGAPPLDGGADHAAAAAPPQPGPRDPASRPVVLALGINWLSQRGAVDRGSTTVLEVSSVHEHAVDVRPIDRSTPGSNFPGLKFPVSTPREALLGPLDASVQLPGCESVTVEKVPAASWVPLPRGGGSPLVHEPLGTLSESSSEREKPDPPPPGALPALVKPLRPMGTRGGSSSASASPVPPPRHDSRPHQNPARSSTTPPSPLQLQRPPLRPLQRSPRPLKLKTPQAPSDLASVGNRNAIAADTYADADVGQPVAAAHASGAIQGSWSWDSALKLNAPSSSWPAAAAAASASIAADDGATLSGARSFSPTMQFMDRLKRVRLMVMCGDLVEGYLQGPYDVTRNAVAAIFPGLSKLGVKQPVWIPAGHLLNWRKDLINKVGADGAADVGGDASSSSSSGPLEAPAREEAQGKRGDKEVPAPGNQVRSRGLRTAAQPSRPTKRIWVAVTSVCVDVRDTVEEASRKGQMMATADAQDGQLPAVAPAGEVPAAAAAAAAAAAVGTAACPGVDDVSGSPAHLVVQVQEVTPPWPQRWASGFATARRQVIASNRGRQVDAHVLAITERGVYCGLQLEAPGRPGDSHRGSKGAPSSAFEEKPTAMSVVGASVAEGEEPDAKSEGPAQVPEAADTHLVVHHQLAFVPRESLAAPLAAAWEDMVAADKKFRARAIGRSVGDVAQLTELHRAKSGADLRGERMRMGDVLVAIVDSSFMCVGIPQFPVMTVLRQVPHQVSGELLRALDIAVPLGLAGPTISAADGGSTTGQGTVVAAAAAAVSDGAACKSGSSSSRSNSSSSSESPVAAGGGAGGTVLAPTMVT
ncbi:hypothetical protein VaNZ11_014751 [Volvox africanus]|uniref:S1 motif domain-containing protein n=1 Tax=Volvox africanus TaxID=51714 RepID=A0ABQ5SJ81_9CHLO|nr:hypothetical protein VaNZ11_014751 [Volvox africanus]